MVLLVFLGILSGSIGQAQGGAPARVRGRVTDPSGAVIAGATIVVTDAAGTVRPATSSRQGAYAVDRLPAGAVSVTASAPGFADAQRSLVVAGGEDATVDFTLAIAVQRQTVEVAATAAVTDPAANANAFVLKGRDLDALSDDPAELEAELHALGGAAAGPLGGQIYIDGFTGGKLPPKSAIQEIRVNQNPYSAEYDAPGSARIEIITRPGGQSFHGRLLADSSIRALDSRNPFLAGPPSYSGRSATVTVEGPLGRKASFAVAFDRVAIDDASPIAAIALDQDLNPVVIRKAIPTTHQTRLFNPRADGQLANGDVVSVRYRLYGLADTASGAGGFALPSQAFDASRTEHDVQISHTHVFSKRTLNEIHGELRRQTLEQAAADFSPQLVVTGAFTGGGNAVGRSSTIVDHPEIFDTLTVSRGAHLIKLGGRLRIDATDDRSQQNVNGTFTFASLDAFRTTELGLRDGWTAAAIRAAGGGASQFSIVSADTGVRQTSADAGVFVEDDWRVAPTVTAGAGLRYERQSGIASAGDLAPRGSIAWAFGRPAKSNARPWVLRGGAGLFYDRIPQTVFLRSLRLDGSHTQQFVIASPDFFPAIPPAGVLAAAQVRTTPYLLSPSLAAPRLLQTGVTLERHLAPGATAALGYVYSRGSRQTYSRNLTAGAAGAEPPIYAFESGGRFDEHQLTANLTVRGSGPVSIGASYVLSGARGDTSGATAFPSNPTDLAADQGRMPFDVRHRLTLFMGIDGPGFRLVPTIFASSGQPYDITVGEDLNGDSIFNDRPAFATDASRPGVVSTPLGLFDTRPAPGAPIVPRNYGTGPAQVLVTLRAMKPFVVRQHDTIRVDVLALNLLNRVNLGLPVGSLASPFFGRSTGLAANGTSSANRQIRIQLQFIF